MSTLGLVTAVILGLYVLVIGVVLLMPARQPDPQRGVGVGCLMIAAGVIAAVLVVVIAADLYHIKWLVWGGFVVAVFPGVSLTGAGIRWFILKARGIEE